MHTMLTLRSSKRISPCHSTKGPLPSRNQRLSCSGGRSPVHITYKLRLAELLRYAPASASPRLFGTGSNFGFLGDVIECLFQEADASKLVLSMGPIWEIARRVLPQRWESRVRPEYAGLERPKRPYHKVRNLKAKGSCGKDLATDSMDSEMGVSLSIKRGITSVIDLTGGSSDSGESETTCFKRQKLGPWGEPNGCMRVEHYTLGLIPPSLQTTP